jgi:hypothetical protein
MDVYTTHISLHHIVKEMGVYFIDTTHKTGHAWFAPSKEMSHGYLYHGWTPERYTEEYRDRMLKAFGYAPYREEWERVLAMPAVAFACYCKPGAFCHRLLLRDIFKTICERRGMEFHDKGEIRKPGSNPRHYTETVEKD